MRKAVIGLKWRLHACHFPGFAASVTYLPEGAICWGEEDDTVAIPRPTSARGCDRQELCGPPATSIRLS